MTLMVLISQYLDSPVCSEIIKSEPAFQSFSSHWQQPSLPKQLKCWEEDVQPHHGSRVQFIHVCRCWGEDAALGDRWHSGWWHGELFFPSWSFQLSKAIWASIGGAGQDSQRLHQQRGFRGLCDGDGLCTFCQDTHLLFFPKRSHK